MIGALRLLTGVCLLAVTAAAVLVADPGLPAQVSQALHGDSTGPAAATPLRPLDTPTSASSPASSPTPPPTLAPTPSSTTTPPPTPTSAAPQAQSLSFADSTWTVVTLTVDGQLDAQAESTYPQAATYYRGWAGRWAQTLTWFRAEQADGLAFAGTACSSPLGWFAEAIRDHAGDTQANPGDKSWNDEWIANYQRLTGIWNQLCA